VLALTAVSCAGPANGPANTPARPTAIATAPGSAQSTAPSDESWAAASWEDRHDTMEFVVHPTMARLFQAHDRKPAPDMTCRTCHGADAEAVQYKMPHGLPALDPAHLPDPAGADARAKTAKFMIEEVTPKMIELLDVAPYDPKTKRGFGCFNCHPSSAKP
jgi:hypothetical protein